MSEEEEDEDLRMEVEDLNDMLSDLGFKGLDFDADVKGKKMKQMKKSGWFRGLTRKIARKIQKKKNVNPNALAKELGYVDQDHPVLVLKFLASELQTCELLKETARLPPPRNEVDSEVEEILSRICKRVSGNTPESVCTFLERSKSSSSSTTPSSSLLSRSELLPEHTRVLSQMNRVMREEYKTRRAMLLQRMDITIESFMESPRVEGKEKDVLDVILEPRKRMCKDPKHITVDHIFDANTSLIDRTRLRVTTNAPASFCKSVSIGNVPDRGGRADEMRPSKNEIHGFHRRSSSSSKSSSSNVSKKKKRKNRIQRGNGRTSSSSRNNSDGAWKKGGGGHRRR